MWETSVWEPHGCPGDKGATHYLNTYFSYDNREVMTADGILTQKNGKDTLEVTHSFEHLP